MSKHYKAFGICLLALAVIDTLLLMLRPGKIPYQALVYRYATAYGLEPAMVFGVIRTESNFDPDACSPKDARGLMQITPETLDWAMARENKGACYTAEDLYDPAVNIKYGCLILSMLYEEFEADSTVWAAYNAGRGNVQKWLKDRRYCEDGITIHKTPYKETNQYIEKVRKYRQEYRETLG